MPIAKKLSRWLFYGVVVPITVLIMLLYSSVAVINSTDWFDDFIHRQLREQLAMPVDFSSVQAEWRLLSLQLQLQDVRIKNDGTDADDVITFDQINARISLLRSIRTGSVAIKAVDLSGLGIPVTEQEDGKFRIGDRYFSIGSWSQEDTSSTPWYLLTQFPHITISGLEIILTRAQTNTKVLHFREGVLKLRNEQDGLQITLDITPPAEYAKQLQLGLHTTHSENSIPVAELKMRVTQPQWKHLLGLAEVSASSPTDELILSSRWQEDHLSELQAHITMAELTEKSTAFSLSDMELSVNIIRPSREQGNLSISHNAFVINDGAAKAATHTFSFVTKDRQIQSVSGNLSALPLDGMQALLALPVPTLPKPGWLQELTAHYNIGGILEEATFSLQPGMPGELPVLDYQARLSALRFGQPEKNTPAWQLASKGNIIVHGDMHRVQMELDNNRILVAAPLFAEMPPLEKVSMDLSVMRDAAGKDIRLTFANASLVNSDLSLEADGELLFPHQGEAFLNLQAHLQDTQVNSFYRYLPTNMHPKFLRWMRNAFIDGTLTFAEVDVSGKLRDLPYRNDEGSLNALLYLESVDMKYHPLWPEIYDVDMEMTFKNEEIIATTNGAFIYDTRLIQSTWHIPDYMEKGNIWLNIDGALSGHSDDVLRFIAESPLKEHTALSRLKTLDIHSDVNLDLKLELSLNKKPATVEGLAKVADATMTFPLPDNPLSLQKINGSIAFDKEQVTAEKLSVSYDTLPVDFSFYGMIGKPLVMLFDSHLSEDFLLQQLKSFYPDLQSFIQVLQKILRGNADWALQIAIDFANKSTEMQLKSPLQGLSVWLPPPLAKEKEASRNFVLSSIFKDKKIQPVTIEYGDHQIVFRVDNSTEKLITEGIGIGFAQAATVVANETVHVRGELAQLNLTNWRKIFALTEDSLKNNKEQLTSNSEVSAKTDVKMIAATEVKKSSWLPDIDILVGELQLTEDVVFEEVRIQIVAQENGQSIVLQGEKIDGIIFIPVADTVQPWQINMQKLYLDAQNKNNLENDLEGGIEDNTEDNMSVATDVSPTPVATEKNFPPAQINIQNFYYDGMELGKVYIELQPGAEEENLISEITLEKQGITAQGTGRWFVEDEQIYSELQLNIIAESFDLLQASIIESHEQKISGASTVFDLDLNWPGSPAEFDLEKVLGTLKVDIGKGAINDLEITTGRLIGLLNLNVLPRRMTLDFSDVFGSGFTFDSITGDFSFDKGDAYTSNLSIISPSAQIALLGRVGLVAQDYDQQALVIPSVSENVPLLSALLGPIGIGIGVAYFVNQKTKLIKFLPNTIEKLLQKEYHITGSWENPNVELVKKFTPDNNLQDDTSCCG